jgi:predicted ATP-grasp superfamily ATP-dependent carboligase
MADPQKVVVLIVGADHPTGLGMGRSLFGRGRHIIGMYRNESPCCRSKVWDQLVKFDHCDEIVERLVRMGEERKEKAALFVAADNFVKLISDHREVLTEYYSFLLPDKKVIDCFLDKTSFHEWATRHGFKVPASYVCSSFVEFEECLSRVPFPVIVKPFEKTEEWDRCSPVHKTFHLCEKKDLEKINFDLFSASPKILVQQWIPGGDRNVYFSLVCYNGQGRKVASFSGRKLFQWPVLCGSTAAAIGEENDEVTQVTEKIFDLVGYRGLGSVEFKRSEVDGQYYIIEPTVGRNDLQSNLARSGGVNLPAFALAEVLDTSPVGIKRRRSAWIHEEGLLDAIRICRKEKCLRKADLLKLLCPSIEFAHFSIGDPSPGFNLIRKKFQRKFIDK